MCPKEQQPQQPQRGNPSNPGRQDTGRDTERRPGSTDPKRQGGDPNKRNEDQRGR